MTGELFALLSAVFYGLAGLAITAGKDRAKGDNGVFLSVCFTALFSFLLWAVWGHSSLGSLFSADNRFALGMFALSGICATVIGRTCMYRTTERSGAVVASLYRRLIPVFVVPCAFLLLNELPSLQTFVGGGIILIGVMAYLVNASKPISAAPHIFDLFGIALALFYALAYTLRCLGLSDIPDPLLGTLIGALTGMLWFLSMAALSPQPHKALSRLIVDRGIWHFTTAISLSAGQILQFFAVKYVDVSTAAILGSFEVFITGALVVLVFKTESIPIRPFLFAATTACLGAVIILL